MKGGGWEGRGSKEERNYVVDKQMAKGQKRILLGREAPREAYASFDPSHNSGYQNRNNWHV
jgi:hypothetical protein